MASDLKMPKRKAKRDPSPDRSRSSSPVPTTSRGTGAVVETPRPGGVGRGRRRLPPTVVPPGRQLAQQSLLQFVVQQRDPDGSRQAETDEESVLDEDDGQGDTESPAAVAVAESSTGSRRPLRTAAAAVPSMAESPVGSDQGSSDEDFVPYRPAKDSGGPRHRQAGKTFIVLYFFPPPILCICFTVAYASPCVWFFQRAVLKWSAEMDSA